jgi:hypothetical protein
VKVYKVWTGVAAAGLVLALFHVGKTNSYQTGFDSDENIVGVGRNTTTIEEVFPDPSPVPLPENPQYTKRVWVSNEPAGNGYSVDCYVRVLLLYSDYDIGRAVTLLNLNLSDWEYREDGYYYYRQVLRTGEETSTLFEGFSIDSTKVEDSCRSVLDTFSISVYEESVQAEGFTDYQDAWAFYLDSAVWA